MSELDSELACIFKTPRDWPGEVRIHLVAALPLKLNLIIVPQGKSERFDALLFRPVLVNFIELLHSRVVVLGIQGLTSVYVTCTGL